MDYNLKIQVNHENESSDAQAMFFALGGSWRASGTEFTHLDQPYLYLSRDVVRCGSDAKHFRCDDGAEITLEALRDLVHAKKNSENEKEMNILDEGRYVEKEYINKATGEYRKTADVVSGEQWIEVLPQHSFAFKKENGDVRLSHGFGSYFGESLLWTRAAKPEAVPFADNEPSINDQYAEIEEVRQEKKHSHYKKDVSGLDFVDVYRVLKLFDVTDPCLQHAVKKLLCSGQRGVKDVDKDIQEAIDSLLRYQEMKKEDFK